MSTVDRYVEKFLDTMTVLLFCGMMVVVMIQVVCRYIPSVTVSWTEETTRLLFVFAMCLGAPVAMKGEEYVYVDLLTEKMPDRFKNICFGILYFLVAVFCFVSCYQSIGYVQTGATSVSPTLKVNMAFMYSSVLIAFFGMGAYALANTYKYIRKFQGKYDDGKGETK